MYSNTKVDDAKLKHPDRWCLVKIPRQIMPTRNTLADVCLVMLSIILHNCHCPVYFYWSLSHEWNCKCSQAIQSANKFVEIFSYLCKKKKKSIFKKWTNEIEISWPSCHLISDSAFLMINSPPNSESHFTVGTCQSKNIAVLEITMDRSQSFTAGATSSVILPTSSAAF